MQFIQRIFVVFLIVVSQACYAGSFPAMTAGETTVQYFERLDGVQKAALVFFLVNSENPGSCTMTEDAGAWPAFNDPSFLGVYVRCGVATQGEFLVMFHRKQDKFVVTPCSEHEGTVFDCGVAAGRR